MQADELTALFDQQAKDYDARWSRTAPIRSCLHLLLESFFSTLPAHAQLLCVGAGTGAEVAYLAERMPHWRFTVVEPSGAMLEKCRLRAEAEGFASRCQLHHGYLDQLPQGVAFDAATCFLVSQFMLDQDQRRRFFESIGRRLKPGGLLASSDLSADTQSPDYATLLAAWMSMMGRAQLSEIDIANLREAYAKDVAIVAPGELEVLIKNAGFSSVVGFFQAGLMRAWCSRWQS